MELSKIATRYYQAVSSYDQKSIRDLVREDYIQHNPFLKTGRQAFLDIIPSLQANQTKINNQRLLVDGQFVIMHHIWKNAKPFGADELVAFHIIRLNSEFEIAEHWNVITENLKPNPSGRSQYDGAKGIDDFQKTEENRLMVEKLMGELIDRSPDRYLLAYNKYLERNFIQHHPDIGDGIEGLGRAMKNDLFLRAYQNLHRVFAQGNFVLSVSDGFCNGVSHAIYDLYRLKNAKIAEWWTISQEIPSKGVVNSNSMFGF